MIKKIWEQDVTSKALIKDIAKVLKQFSPPPQYAAQKIESRVQTSPLITVLKQES